MKILANKLSSIPVSNKPLGLGGKVQWMTPEALREQFGIEFEEKIEWAGFPCDKNSPCL